ncbi:D-isomer specific 2-hydroxyacid dehydrogenase [Aspergillus karnatakaensis]|uniref:D-mandelate dehydrogenase-like dehydrogenase n=1 Tax=Aspergillus karnatakaensis TaxID=1810916 RepID=UPI003CCDC33B
MAENIVGRLLLIGRLQYCQSEWSALRLKYNLLQFQGDRQQFLEKCQSGAFNGVVGLYRTNSIAETGNFDQTLVSKLPSTLRYIGHNGAGYDNINVDACAARGIRISNTPGVIANATADVAMFLILGALRYAMIPLEAVRNNEWKGNTPTGRDPEDRTLGILGMGGIGQALARRARAFSMKIIYHNRTRLPEQKEVTEGEATYVTFDELLQQSDIMSLNLPLTAATHHLISEPEIQRMKDGVVIINTARGPLLNEDALVKGLQSGKVGSAGLDVYEKEPEIHPQPVSNRRVMLLPHLGTTTIETKRKMELLAINNLESALDKSELLTPIAML